MNPKPDTTELQLFSDERRNEAKSLVSSSREDGACVIRNADNSPIPTLVTRRAFTLIELLVVIAIIGILAGILVVTVSKVRQTAQGAKCGANLRQICLAALLYADEHKDKFPPFWRAGTMNWNDRLNEYLGGQPYSLQNRYHNNPVWFCPAAELLNNDKFNRHYGLNTYIRDVSWDFWRSIVPNPSRTILIGEINRNTEGLTSNDPSKVAYRGDVDTVYRISHKGGTGANYAFCDGHVEYRIGYLADQNAATSPWKWW